MKKVLYAILACIAITGILWGCNLDKKEVTSGKEAVNISFSFWEPSTQNDLEDALTKVIANYNKIHPEVRIELISKQVNGYEEWLKEQFASNKAPTIISDHAPNILEYHKKGLAMDLSNALDNPTPYSNVPWKELFLDMDTIKQLNGVALAWFDFGMAYYYNVDLYENLGLSVPKTWAEFMNNCQVIKERGVTPIALMAQKEGALEWLGQYISAGLLGRNIERFKEFDTAGNGISKDEHAVIVERGMEQEFKQTFIESQKRFWEEIGKYISYTENSIETDEAEAKEQILDGVAGHIMSGSWDVKNLYIKPDSKNRMGIFRLPEFTDEDGPYASSNPYIGGVQGVCVSSCGTEEERAAAIDFLEFLFSEEQYRIFIEETMLLPTMKGCDTDDLKDIFVPRKIGVNGLTFKQASIEKEYILKIVTGTAFDYDAAAEELYEKYYGTQANT